MSLKKLALRPIDVLVLARARADAHPDATRAEASELDRRILEAAHAALGLTEETPGRITYGRPDAGFDPATDRSFTDLLELARTAADIIAKSRPLTPRTWSRKIVLTMPRRPITEPVTPSPARRLRIRRWTPSLCC
mgnify:CR=1 FL=1